MTWLLHGDPASSIDGYEGAYRYLARSVENASGKLNRTKQRRRRGLPPAAMRDELDDAVDRATAETGDPCDRLLQREEFSQQLAFLADVPSDQQRVLIERAAGFAPSEIQRRMGLTSRQYRKRIEKARRALPTP